MADGIGIRFDSTSYSATDERRLAAVLAAPSTALLARGGRRPGGGLEVTVGGSPEAATVAVGGGIITDATRGSYIFVIPSAVSINLAARPSTGTSRLDEVVAVVKNQDIVVGDGSREIDIQVITGTAGSSPSAPTIPANALRLAELNVPASGSVSVSKAPARISALGGITPVANSTERDALSLIYDGLVVYREDTDVLEVRAGGAWAPVRAGDTGWSNATLKSGFTAASGVEPQYRTIGGNDVRGGGRINGTFAASTVIPVADAGAFPAPFQRHEAMISGHTAAAACRAYIDTDGSLTVVTGASAPAYVYIDGLFPYTKD